MSKQFWALVAGPDLELIRPGASAGDRRRESHASATNGGEHQADSGDGSKHPVECAKDLAGGDRQPLLAGSRLAGANGARRRLFHGPGAVSGIGDFGRAALLRRARGKFAKHHFDADKRASTRQKPHGTGDGPPGGYSLHELGQHDRDDRRPHQLDTGNRDERRHGLYQRRVVDREFARREGVDRPKLANSGAKRPVDRPTQRNRQHGGGGGEPSEPRSYRRFVGGGSRDAIQALRTMSA